MCERGTAARSSLTGWTPTLHRQSTPAAVPDFPCEGERRTISAKQSQAQSVQTFAKLRKKPHGDKSQVHLDLHTLWLNDMNLVLVATPHFIVDDGHAADGVMRPAEVHEVIVGQIPLTVWGKNKHFQRLNAFFKTQLVKLIIFILLARQFALKSVPFCCFYFLSAIECIVLNKMM